MERLQQQIEILQDVAASGERLDAEQYREVVQILQDELSSALDTVEAEEHMKELEEAEEEAIKQIEGQRRGAVLQFKDELATGRKEYVGRMRLKDSRHGLGTMTWADGTTCKGEWLHDQSWGHACEWYPDGSVYKGQFREDMREGLGVMETAAGQIYVGEWHQGMRHGKAIVILRGADGESQRFLCTFVDNAVQARAPIEERAFEYKEWWTRVQHVREEAEARALEAQTSAATISEEEAAAAAERRRRAYNASRARGRGSRPPGPRIGGRYITYDWPRMPPPLLDEAAILSSASPLRTRPDRKRPTPSIDPAPAPLPSFAPVMDDFKMTSLSAEEWEIARAARRKQEEERRRQWEEEEERRRQWEQAEKERIRKEEEEKRRIEEERLREQAEGEERVRRLRERQVVLRNMRGLKRSPSKLHVIQDRKSVV